MDLFNFGSNPKLIANAVSTTYKQECIFISECPD